MFNYKKHARALFGFILGVFAGMSLNATIYPSVVASVMGMDNLDFIIHLEPWQHYTMILWGIALALLAWAPSTKWGMALLGTTGFVTGLFYGLAVLSSPTEGLPIEGVAAGVIISTTYGVVMGILFGKIWTQTA